MGCHNCKLETAVRKLQKRVKELEAIIDPPKPEPVEAYERPPLYAPDREPYKCDAYELGCREWITKGNFCGPCAREYLEDPDAFK